MSEWRRAGVTCAAVALTTAAMTGVATAAGDTEAPQAPVVSSAEYPDDGNEHDGVGSYGTFVLDSASDDVVSYRYEWMGGLPGTLKPAEPGAAVSLRWLPQTNSPTYLYAQAIDAAGNVSARTTYFVRVTSGRAAVTHWDPQHDSGADTGTGVTPDAQGPTGTSIASAARFDGTDEAYATLDSAVDTAKIFSVGAWVRPDVLDADMTAVSRTGFSLGLTANSSDSRPTWSFALPTVSGGSVHLTGGSPEPGEWAHLVGVYDAEQHTARLYVDGDLVATAENTVAAGGTGPLRLGSEGDTGDTGATDGTAHWHGLLTDVSVWDRVYVPGEITAAATRTPQRQGYWDLETVTGGSSPEYAGGAPLTLAGDASIYTATDDCDVNPDCTPARYPMVGYGDLLLDGDGDYATTPDAVRPTDAGFSVTTHVRIDGDTATHDMTLLSQPGLHTSLFTLRYVAASQSWQAVVAHEDSADAPTTTVTAPLSPFGSGEDEFLAVVYDERTDQLRLYVDDIYAADSASVTGKDTWTPAGDLQIGRSVTAGTGTDYLTGELDEVHTYAGVLDQTRLAMLRLGGVDA
ncbi:Concanavalin A-like lectin/glucanases superfamily protein [Streptomyces sp. 3213]|uniref:LamG domain-containing protein n=1 Tax=Streptomyces sp. 3213.3 TaxID=1855348 RepID=UPI0008959AF9|nr:LamG domain-containing protein [Streptomyces sp. 3213.3]SEE31685.1 Concanavalin A-like lectin/glucanases superfamily protein [Streptomyces sp. 3213] [Streptomyces sp. 3213.3]